MGEKLQKPVPYLVNLKDLLLELGESEVRKILLRFDCVFNGDVNYFLHEKAIEFTKRGFSTTYLVFCPFVGSRNLLGILLSRQKALIFINFPASIANIKIKLPPMRPMIGV